MASAVLFLLAIESMLIENKVLFVIMSIKKDTLQVFTLCVCPNSGIKVLFCNWSYSWGGGMGVNIDNQFYKIDFAFNFGTITSQLKDRLDKCNNEPYESHEKLLYQLAGVIYRFCNFYSTLENPLSTKVWHTKWGNFDRVFSDITRKFLRKEQFDVAKWILIVEEAAQMRLEYTRQYLEDCARLEGKRVKTAVRIIREQDLWKGVTEQKVQDKNVEEDLYTDRESSDVGTRITDEMHEAEKAFQLGVLTLEKKDESIEDAVFHFRQAAKQGHGSAAVKLMDIYQQNAAFLTIEKGLRRSIEKGIEYLKRAAILGEVGAVKKLRSLYELDDADPEDLIQAEWYRIFEKILGFEESARACRFPTSSSEVKKNQHKSGMPVQRYREFVERPALIEAHKRVFHFFESAQGALELGKRYLLVDNEGILDLLENHLPWVDERGNKFKFSLIEDSSPHTAADSSIRRTAEVCKQLGARFFERASRLGLLEGEYELGKLYTAGSSVTRDLFKGIVHYTKAAEIGHVEAAYQLGNLYSANEGEIQRDLPAAVRFYNFAVSSNHIEAAYQLGRIYSEGTDDESDLSRAIELYTIASQGNHPEAAYQLGNLLLEGDIEKAISQYKHASGFDHLEATYRLGVVYFFGGGVDKKLVAYCEESLAPLKGEDTLDQNTFPRFDIKGDFNEALRYLNHASEREHLEANYLLGQIYYYFYAIQSQDTSADIAKIQDFLTRSIKYLERAHLLNHPKSSNLLGVIFRSCGKGLDNPAKAFQYFSASYYLGYPTAAFNLGTMYLTGDGVKQDLFKAVEYYKMASTLGVTHAANEFSKIYSKRSAIRNNGYFTHASSIGSEKSGFFSSLLKRVPSGIPDFSPGVSRSLRRKGSDLMEGLNPLTRKKKTFEEEKENFIEKIAMAIIDNQSKRFRALNDQLRLIRISNADLWTQIKKDSELEKWLLLVKEWHIMAVTQSYNNMSHKIEGGLLKEMAEIVKQATEFFYILGEEMSKELQTYCLTIQRAELNPVDVSQSFEVLKLEKDFQEQMREMNDHSRSILENLFKYKKVFDNTEFQELFDGNDETKLRNFVRLFDDYMNIFQSFFAEWNLLYNRFQEDNTEENFILVIELFTSEQMTQYFL